MTYTIYIANHDYGTLSLDKKGNRYVIEAYIGGWGVSTKKTFTDYDEAEKRYFEMCKNSHITPVKVEHDEYAMMTNVD